ncbi:unnamed protein product, partial [Laminaria digitata]
SSCLHALKLLSTCTHVCVHRLVCMHRLGVVVVMVHLEQRSSQKLTPLVVLRTVPFLLEDFLALEVRALYRGVDVGCYLIALPMNNTKDQTSTGTAAHIFV